jgi:hypothetical protein
MVGEDNPPALNQLRVLALCLRIAPLFHAIGSTCPSLLQELSDRIRGMTLCNWKRLIYALFEIDRMTIKLQKDSFDGMLRVLTSEEPNTFDIILTEHDE